MGKWRNYVMNVQSEEVAFQEKFILLFELVFVSICCVTNTQKKISVVYSNKHLLSSLGVVG